MSDEYVQLIDDLADEVEALDGLVAAANLDLPTLAAGWSIGDTIQHLLTTDRSVLLALRDPEEFERLRIARLEQPGPAVAEPARGDGDPRVLLDTWRTTRQQVVEAFRSLEPATRVAWHGPSMSARSFATSRIMEYWSHGEDIAQALGQSTVPSLRLRHVCHLGYITMRFSFATHDEPEPMVPIYVELAAPVGSAWSWGERDSPESLRGEARDFCLVVTQRRHVEDTGLKTSGPTADAWMHLAQAFAGKGTTTSEARRGIRS
jgi:uncharacterized protein (TIGR03084 family)